MLDTPMPEKTIAAVAARLGELQAALAARPVEVPAGELHAEIGDLEDLLARSEPRTPAEALIVTAVAYRMARETDEVAGCLHERTIGLLARLVACSEAAAGVSAAELGLAHYTAGPEGPLYPDADRGSRFLAMMQRAYDNGRGFATEARS